LKILIKKTLEILTTRDKKNILISIVLLIIKSILEVIGIGLIIPILTYTTSQNEDKFLYDTLPFLQRFDNQQLILFLVIIFVFVYLIKTLFNIFYNFWSARFTNNLSVNLTNRVLKKYLNKNYIFFLENNPSFFVRNITSETSLFAMGLIGNLITCFTQIVFIFSVCLFLVIYNFYSFYVILFLFFVCGIIMKTLNNKFHKWGLVRLEGTASLLKKISEIIGSVKEVILYNKRQFFTDEVYIHNKKLAKANIYRDTALAFGAPIVEFIAIFIFFSFFLILIIYSSIDLSEVTILFGVFAFACVKLLPAATTLLRSLQGIKFNMPACDVVYDILINSDVPNNFSDTEKYKKTILKSIKFENISFSYKNQKNPTLDQVNFEINKGDKIAIIGETGSGKTTLLNIIATLVTPSNGKIKINGSDQLDGFKEIRNNIGYVPQSVYLSDNSIISNIGLSNEFSLEDEDKILTILKSLNLSVINNRPINLYDTIGDRGSKLSGGQIQRIGIARALFRDPAILILDEATNALDAKTEKKILDNISKMFEDKFIILCTHKKELLKYCNKILEVKNNTVIFKTSQDR
jgi:ABC-type multidrug transport system fused ATPase/permease subunit